MKNITSVLGLCILFFSATLCRATAPDEGRQATTQAPSGRAFLGVRVEPTHRTLVAHLLHLLGEGHGALVVEVDEGSPAEKAGLKVDDILASYDGQPVYGPKHLVKLIHSDQPGHEAALGVIHAGKREEIEVTLGEQDMATGRRVFRPAISGDEPRAGADEQETDWVSFDAMTLTRDNEGKFHAQIKFRDDQGNIETHSFEGTRAELRSDINAEKDLPALERDHLLRALNLTSRRFPLDILREQY